MSCLWTAKSLSEFVQVASKTKQQTFRRKCRDISPPLHLLLMSKLWSVFQTEMNKLYRVTCDLKCCCMTLSIRAFLVLICLQQHRNSETWLVKWNMRPIFQFLAKLKWSLSHQISTPKTQFFGLKKQKCEHSVLQMLHALRSDKKAFAVTRNRSTLIKRFWHCRKSIWTTFAQR